MAILHAATITPTKAEIIADWLPTRSWAPPGAPPAELVGSYRFDDPEGDVGLEVHLVRWADTVLQVPLSYRDAPLEGGEAALVGTMEHSVLGERFVYDGVGDPLFVRMLAAVTMTGCGQAVGMVEYDGRWVVAPPPVTLRGGGWGDERVAVDRFEQVADDGGWEVLVNDRFELRIARRPVPGDRPPIGLVGTWAGQDEAVVLAEVRRRTGS